MPYLRVSRDKRGYETTYLMHAFRRRGTTRTTVLYLHRTPPSVRVGRAALDPEAMRQVEAQYPGLAFDWPTILRSQTQPAPATPRTRRAKADATARGRARPGTGGGGSARIAAASAPTVQEEGSAPSTVEASSPATAMRDGSAPSVDGAPRPAESTSRRGGTIDRLRGRRAMLMTRITERIEDVARRDALLAELSGLDPDAWTTPEQTRDGTAAFERLYGELRQEVGLRPRRSRRGSRRSRAPVGTPDEASRDLPSQQESVDSQGGDRAVDATVHESGPDPLDRG